MNIQDELFKELELIEYLNQLKSKGIEFKFWDKQIIKKTKDSERFYNSENTEVESDKIKRFYKLLFETKKAEFSGREIDFIEHQIKYLETKIDPKHKDKYHYKFTPFLTYLKNAIDSGGVLNKKELLKTFALTPNQIRNIDKIESVFNVLNQKYIECTLPEFKKIFSGSYILPEQQIKWLGTPSSLNYFLKGIFKQVKWGIADNCFIYSGNTPLKDTKSPSAIDKVIIDKAIEHFPPPDKK